MTSRRDANLRPGEPRRPSAGPRLVGAAPEVSWHEDVLHTFALDASGRFGVHQHDAHQFVFALDVEERANLERVLVDCCRRHASSGDVVPGVVLPVDDRDRRVAEQLTQDPGDGLDLSSWATLVGASTRTLVRLFRADTGLGFEQWRRHARMHIAHTMLLDGASVERCARHVGSRNASAFGAAFRTTFGYPPTQVAAALSDRARTGTAD